MTKEEAKKKREYHNKRYQFYDKKIKELDEPTKIGFKIKRSCQSQY
jgi:hypothetical protein